MLIFQNSFPNLINGVWFQYSISNRKLIKICNSKQWKIVCNTTNARNLLVFSVSATIEAFQLHIENRRATIKCAQTRPGWQTRQTFKVPLSARVCHNPIINFIPRGPGQLAGRGILRTGRKLFKSCSDSHWFPVFLLTHFCWQYGVLAAEYQDMHGKIWHICPVKS